MNRRPLAVAAAVALASALLGAARVAGADAVVTVLGVRNVDADDLAAANLAGALRRVIAEVPGWTHSGRELTLAQMGLAFGCDDPFAPNCLLQVGQHTRSQKLVFGTLRRSGSDFVANLQVFSVAERRIERSVTETFNRSATDAQAFAAIALRVVRSLAGVPERGRLIVATNVPAEVAVDGQNVGTTGPQPLSASVAVGEHRVRIHRDGYREVVRTVQVAADASARVDATLEPEGPATVARPDRAATGAPGALPSGDAEPVAPVPEGPASVAWLGFGAVGAGAALALLGGFATLQVDATNNDPRWIAYRAIVPAGQDMCAAARAGDPAPQPDLTGMCATGELFQVLQYVFYFTGVALAGLGSYLIATHRPGESRERRPAASPAVAPVLSIEFRPHASATGAGIEAALRF